MEFANSILFLFCTQLLLWALAAGSVGTVCGVLYVNNLFKYAGYDPGSPSLNYIAYGTAFGCTGFLFGFLSNFLFLLPLLRPHRWYASIFWAAFSISLIEQQHSMNI